MPYDPGISFQGGQLLAQGIGHFGEAIGTAITEAQKKREQQAKDLAQSDLLMDWGTKHGYVTPEQSAKYAGLDVRKKADMADTLSKTMALDQAQKLREEELQNNMAVAQAHIAGTLQAARISAGAQMGAVNPKSGAPYGQNVGDIIYHPTSGMPIGVVPPRGGPSYYPQATDQTPFQAPSQMSVITDPRDPSKTVGLIPTGPKQLQVSPYDISQIKAPEHTPGDIYYDPETGEAKGVWAGGDRPFVPAKGNALQEEIATRLREARLHPTPTPAPGGGWFGGGAKPTPTPYAPTTMPPPANTPPPLPAAPAAPAFGLQMPNVTLPQTTAPQPGISQDPATRALAAQALNDPNASAEHKAAARKILGL